MINKEDVTTISDEAGKREVQLIETDLIVNFD